MGASTAVRLSISPEPRTAEEAPDKMSFQDITNEAIKAAIAAVVAIVMAMLFPWIKDAAMRARKSVQNMQNQNSPTLIGARINQFLVMTALMWMLQRTVALSGPHPGPWEIVLIAAWTWAVLTYALHIARTRK